MRSRTRERTQETGPTGTPSRGRPRRGRNARKGAGSTERGPGSDKGGSNRDEGERGGDSQNRSGRRSKGAKGKGRKRSSPPGRRNQRPQRGADTAKFWGEPEGLPSPGSDVRITDDPAAVPRSLGPPPLRGHEAIAEHYFRVVYDRAVTTAGALAAAGGLIDPDVLTDEAQH